MRLASAPSHTQTRRTSPPARIRLNKAFCDLRRLPPSTVMTITSGGEPLGGHRRGRRPRQTPLDATTPTLAERSSTLDDNEQRRGTGCVRRSPCIPIALKPRRFARLISSLVTDSWRPRNSRGRRGSRARLVLSYSTPTITGVARSQRLRSITSAISTQTIAGSSAGSGFESLAVYQSGPRSGFFGRGSVAYPISTAGDVENHAAMSSTSSIVRGVTPRSLLQQPVSAGSGP